MGSQPPTEYRLPPTDYHPLTVYMSPTDSPPSPIYPSLMDYSPPSPIYPSPTDSPPSLYSPSPSDIGPETYTPSPSDIEPETYTPSPSDIGPEKYYSSAIPLAAPTPTPTPVPLSKNLSKVALVGLIVGIVIAGVIVIGVGIFVMRRKKRKEKGVEFEAENNVVPPQGPKDEPSSGPSQCRKQNTFTYEELAKATDGFSDANLLGQGGFGKVQKGVLPNGKVVAIKRLKADSGQGEREFQAEVEIISRVHHRHLVSLVGYCIAGAQRMLVYEYVPNNTLKFHLHGKGQPVMNWPIRMKIAVGSAKGLAYLHEDSQPKTIHRDIKAANILLDYSFEPKVADFGLAKSALDTDTHISTRIMGTPGYLAPEYASSGKLTDKSDVFSFGVILLELITGRRPVDRTESFIEDSIVDWARPLLTRVLEDGNFDSLVDPRLQKDFDSNEMVRVVACAAACVRHSSRRRPRMSQIVRALEGNVTLDDLNEGITPGHSTKYGSSDYNSSQYRENFKKFKNLALETQEHGSSEYSSPTSEYGLNPSSSSSEGQQTTQEMELQKMEKDTKK